jgi:hypothetical protein
MADISDTVCRRFESCWGAPTRVHASAAALDGEVQIIAKFGDDLITIRRRKPWRREPSHSPSCRLPISDLEPYKSPTEINSFVASLSFELNVTNAARLDALADVVGGAPAAHLPADRKAFRTVRTVPDRAR